MAQAVTAEARFRSRASLCDKVELRQVFLQYLFSPVSIIPPLLHTQFILTGLLSERHGGETWRTSNKAVVFMMYTFHIFPYAVPLPPISSHAVKYKSNVL